MVAEGGSLCSRIVSFGVTEAARVCHFDLTLFLISIVHCRIMKCIKWWDGQARGKVIILNTFFHVGISLHHMPICEL